MVVDLFCALDLLGDRAAVVGGLCFFFHGDYMAGRQCPCLMFSKVKHEQFRRFAPATLVAAHRCVMCLLFESSFSGEARFFLSFLIIVRNTPHVCDGACDGGSTSDRGGIDWSGVEETHQPRLCRCVSSRHQPTTSIGHGLMQVMSMSTALGLSSDFCGDDGGDGTTGGAFSVEVSGGKLSCGVYSGSYSSRKLAPSSFETKRSSSVISYPCFSPQRVGSLAAEAMSLVDADGAAEMGDGCSHPLLEAKTPRELALLVKHYRLLQVRDWRTAAGSSLRCV